MKETALPSSGVQAMIGSLPTWSMTTPLPEALAEPGMVTGTGTPHESPSARTLRPVMVWVSVEKMYSMLGLHLLFGVSTLLAGGEGGRRREMRGGKGGGGLEKEDLLESHAVDELLRNVIVLEGANRPVGKTGELLRDGLDPDLQQRELAANITNSELGGILMTLVSLHSYRTHCNVMRLEKAAYIR